MSTSVSLNHSTVLFEVVARARSSVSRVGRTKILAVLACIAGASMMFAGCSGNKLPVAPVEGRVLLEGEPLRFGSVMFQPTAGPPAHGQIQPDGTFVLSTYGDGDGAVLGRHKVRIACFDTQSPDYVAPTGPDAEAPQGRALISKKYGMLETSGIEVEVKEDNKPFTFNLQSR